MSGISTHVLDTALGKPVQGIAVSLEREIAGKWVALSNDTTDSDGRISTMLPGSAALVLGNYKLCFDTDSYFQASGVTSLYPRIEIIFSVLDSNAKYHIPLLLTPNGYTTYRGS